MLARMHSIKALLKALFVNDWMQRGDELRPMRPWYAFHSSCEDDRWLLLPPASAFESCKSNMFGAILLMRNRTRPTTRVVLAPHAFSRAAPPAVFLSLAPHSAHIINSIRSRLNLGKDWEQFVTADETCLHFVALLTSIRNTLKQRVILGFCRSPDQYQKHVESRSEKIQGTFTQVQTTVALHMHSRTRRKVLAKILKLALAREKKEYLEVRQYGQVLSRSRARALSRSLARAHSLSSGLKCSLCIHISHITNDYDPMGRVCAICVCVHDVKISHESRCRNRRLT